MLIINKSLLKRKVFDLTYSPSLRWGLFIFNFLRYCALYKINSQKAFFTLLKAHRAIMPIMDAEIRGDWLIFIEKLISSEIMIRKSSLFNQLLQNKDYHTNRKFTLACGIVLKKPRYLNGTIVERGVILQMHTETFQSLAQLVDLDELMKYYLLVIEPSASSLAVEHILFFSKFSSYPIVVMASEIRDRRFIDGLNSNLISSEISANDWTDDRIFYPISGVKKKYDAIMIAQWGIVKRHHVMFRAVRKLRREGFRLALVGTKVGNQSRDEIESLVNLYGLRSNVDIFESITPDDVNLILNQSKVNVLLSLQEGSNRSITEGFFANVPVIVLKKNVGVNKAYINESTGILIEEDNLENILREFRRNWVNYHPRNWAETHITPPITALKLNAILKKIAQRSGEEWTENIAPKCNNPLPRYYFESDRKTLPTIQEIVDQFAYRRTRGFDC